MLFIVLIYISPNFKQWQIYNKIYITFNFIYIYYQYIIFIGCYLKLPDLVINKYNNNNNRNNNIDYNKSLEEADVPSTLSASVWHDDVTHSTADIEY